MDSSFEQENLDEFESLKNKVDNLEDLVTSATYELFTSNSPDEAQQALVKYLLTENALFQTEMAKLRFHSPDHVKDSAEFSIENSEYYSEIINEGNWISAKELLLGNIGEGEVLSNDVAQKIGLDPDLSIDGVKVFASSPFNLKEVSSETEDTWFKFVESKLALIPDKTEPYTHPNLEIIKAQIASI